MASSLPNRPSTAEALQLPQLVTSPAAALQLPQLVGPGSASGNSPGSPGGGGGRANSGAVAGTSPVVTSPKSARSAGKSSAEHGRRHKSSRETSLQKAVSPVQWALTMRQLKDFLSKSRFTSKYAELKSRKGCVTLHDMNDDFVKPATRGTGCSYALLLNKEAPVQAELMISHAWGEDVEELEDALMRSHAMVSEQTPVWFCLLSIYQTGDEVGDPGPTIQEQLDRQPFQNVIRDLQNRPSVGMLVIHTTTEEVYSRLWCVHEIDEALAAHIVVTGVCSMEYAAKSVGRYGCYGCINDSDIAVSTQDACCSRDEDTKRIRELILKKGNFARLDAVIHAFRREMVQQFLSELHVRPVTPGGGVAQSGAQEPGVASGKQKVAQALVSSPALSGQGSSIEQGSSSGQGTTAGTLGLEQNSSGSGSEGSTPRSRPPSRGLSRSTSLDSLPEHAPEPPPPPAAAPEDKERRASHNSSSSGGSSSSSPVAKSPKSPQQPKPLQGRPPRSRAGHREASSSSSSVQTGTQSSSSAALPAIARPNATAITSTSEKTEPPKRSRGGGSLDRELARRRSVEKHKLAPSKHHHDPRQHLHRGSRDDSFLSAISEGSEPLSSQKGGSSSNNSMIEVFGQSGNTQETSLETGVLTDFSHLCAGEQGAEMQRLLRDWGWEKPLRMQRQVVPLVTTAFRDEQKGFITVQSAPQGGKTSALALGLLSALSTADSGVRAVVLSTDSRGDFEKYFNICTEAHTARLECFLDTDLAPESGSPRASSRQSESKDAQQIDTMGSLKQHLCEAEGAVIIFGHPARVLPFLREAPSCGVDLCDVQLLALDDAEEMIRLGLMDEVCNVCTILRHFSHQRIRHVVLSQTLSHEASSTIRCLRRSILQQQNLFGIRATQTQARARKVNHYFAVAPRAHWPAMLAVLHEALSLPSGIIFDDASPEIREQAKIALCAQGVVASVWNMLSDSGSPANATVNGGAARDSPKPVFHLMASDLVVLKMELPQVHCVLHFELPRRELSIYGLRLMCLEQKKSARKAPKQNSLSVLFVEEPKVVKELEKTFGIKMQELPEDMFGPALAQLRTSTARKSLKGNFASTGSASSALSASHGKLF